MVNAVVELVSELPIIEERRPEMDEPHINPNYVIQLQGKPYPTWPGVLDLAHQLGLQSIDCCLIQIPGEDNEHTAIVKATARLKDGREFSDYGDANPRNCSAKIATALIRLASTRAKGRALRDLGNIGQTMLEELPDLEEERAASSPPRVQRSEPARESSGTTARAAAGGVLVCAVDGCGCMLTSGQHTISMRAYGRQLCPDHQREESKKTERGNPSPDG
jgi:hypothetical protein